MEKLFLRKEIKKINHKLTEKEIRISNAKIINQLWSIPALSNANTVFCYVSVHREVDTFTLIEDLFKLGKQVCVPLCIDKGMMEARQIMSREDLSSGSYGLLEPKTQTPLIPKEKIDFAVVPCISADYNGNRLGYGGGYYDRYLAQAKMEKAVLCRKALMISKIPTNWYDIKMDWVVTEEEAYETADC